MRSPPDTVRQQVEQEDHRYSGTGKSPYADVAAVVLNTEELSSSGFFALVKAHPENEHLVPRGFEW